jgi:hypothetical protein
MNNKPINELEQKALDMIVAGMYNETHVNFYGGNQYPNGQVARRYIRIGYWNEISAERVPKEFWDIVREDTMYDDDCGWLFSYHFYE